MLAAIAERLIANMNSETPDATDYLIAISGGHDFKEMTDFPPVGDPAIDLGRGLSLEKLGRQRADELMDQCTAGDLYAKRQYGELYSFVRRHAPQSDGAPYAWDSDQMITIAVALSRLIRVNAYSAEYALRLIDYGQNIRHVPVACEAKFFAYRANDGERDWLDSGETEELRALINAYWRYLPDMPQRVARAFRYCEMSAREPWLDSAWTNAVTGLESLVHTRRYGSTKQFVSRTTQLAADAGEDEYNDEFAGMAYDRRSQASHGHAVEFGDGSEANNELLLVQGVLRKIVRRCISDPEFAIKFAGVDSIESNWPVD